MQASSSHIVQNLYNTNSNIKVSCDSQDRPQQLHRQLFTNHHTNSTNISQINGGQQTCPQAPQMGSPIIQNTNEQFKGGGSNMKLMKNMNNNSSTINTNNVQAAAAAAIDYQNHQQQQDQHVAPPPHRYINLANLQQSQTIMATGNGQGCFNNDDKMNMAVNGPSGGTVNAAAAASSSMIPHGKRQSTQLTEQNSIGRLLWQDFIQQEQQQQQQTHHFTDQNNAGIIHQHHQQTSQQPYLPEISQKSEKLHHHGKNRSGKNSKQNSNNSGPFSQSNGQNQTTQKAAKRKRIASSQQVVQQCQQTPVNNLNMDGPQTANKEIHQLHHNRPNLSSNEIIMNMNNSNHPANATSANSAKQIFQNNLNGSLYYLQQHNQQVIAPTIDNNCGGNNVQNSAVETENTKPFHSAAMVVVVGSDLNNLASSSSATNKKLQEPVLLQNSKNKKEYNNRQSYTLNQHTNNNGSMKIQSTKSKLVQGNGCQGGLAKTSYYKVENNQKVSRSKSIGAQTINQSTGHHKSKKDKKDKHQSINQGHKQSLGATGIQLSSFGLRDGIHQPNAKRLPPQNPQNESSNMVVSQINFDSTNLNSIPKNKQRNQNSKKQSQQQNSKDRNSITSARLQNKLTCGVLQQQAMRPPIQQHIDSQSYKRSKKETSTQLYKKAQSNLQIQNSQQAKVNQLGCITANNSCINPFRNTDKNFMISQKSILPQHSSQENNEQVIEQLVKQMRNTSPIALRKDLSDSKKTQMINLYKKLHKDNAMAIKQFEDQMKIDHINAVMMLANTDPYTFENNEKGQDFDEQDHQTYQLQQHLMSTQEKFDMLNRPNQSRIFINRMISHLKLQEIQQQTGCGVIECDQQYPEDTQMSMQVQHQLSVQDEGSISLISLGSSSDQSLCLSDNEADRISNNEENIVRQTTKEIQLARNAKSYTNCYNQYCNNKNQHQQQTNNNFGYPLAQGNYMLKRMSYDRQFTTANNSMHELFDNQNKRKKQTKCRTSYSASQLVRSSSQVTSQNKQYADMQNETTNCFKQQSISDQKLKMYHQMIMNLAENNPQYDVQHLLENYDELYAQVNKLNIQDQSCKNKQDDNHENESNEQENKNNQQADNETNNKQNQQLQIQPSSKALLKTSKGKQQQNNSGVVKELKFQLPAKEVNKKQNVNENIKPQRQAIVQQARKIGGNSQQMNNQKSQIQSNANQQTNTREKRAPYVSQIPPAIVPPIKRKKLPVTSANNAKNGQSKQRKVVNVFCTVPRNLREQERRFFDSNFKVNPIFEYDNEAYTTKYIQGFKMEDDPKLLESATRILDSFIQKYKTEQDFRALEGSLLTQEESEQYFNDYIQDLGQEENLTLKFTPNAIAPTAISHGQGKSKIIIALPIDYSQSRIYGVMHHEIGTHFLRRINDKEQMWHKNRQQYEMLNYLESEEGLACINQQLENTQIGRNDAAIKPFLFRPALYYYCCQHAKTCSFVELFAKLEKYVKDPHRRWKYVMRVKRGTTDTSEPGGYYKDKVYLKGASFILQNRNRIDFKQLYAGKISAKDLLLIQKDKKNGCKINEECIKLPSFMADMEKYKEALEEIAQTNFITEIAEDEDDDLQSNNSQDENNQEVNEDEQVE